MKFSVFVMVAANLSFEKICDHFLFIFPKTNISLTKYTRYHQAAAPILKSGILHFRKEKCTRGTRPQTNVSLTKIPRYHQAAASILTSGILHFRKEKCTRGTRPQTNASLTKMPRYHQAAASILTSGILHFRKEKWTRGTCNLALWRTKVAMFAAADESAQKLKHLKRTNPHKFNGPSVRRLANVRALRGRAVEEQDRPV